MRRTRRLIILMATMAFLLIGCGSNKDLELIPVNTEELADATTETGEPVYIVTINISQHHPFWNISDNIKDSMNDIDLEIPVSKEFYDSVEVGTVLDDSFRMGSFIMSGSWGNWDIKIADKRIE